MDPHDLELSIKDESNVLMQAVQETEPPISLCPQRDPQAASEPTDLITTLDERHRQGMASRWRFPHVPGVAAAAPDRRIDTTWSGESVLACGNLAIGRPRTVSA